MIPQYTLRHKLTSFVDIGRKRICFEFLLIVGDKEIETITIYNATPFRDLPLLRSEQDKLKTKMQIIEEARCEAEKYLLIKYLFKKDEEIIFLGEMP